MSKRIIHCETCQEGLYIIRNTPLEQSQMLFLLNDIELAQRDGIFDKWDIKDLKNAWLNHVYQDPKSVLERILSCAQSDRMQMDRLFLLRVTEFLLR
jgi:hypothetical protein